MVCIFYRDCIVCMLRFYVLIKKILFEFHITIFLIVEMILFLLHDQNNKFDIQFFFFLWECP